METSAVKKNNKPGNMNYLSLIMPLLLKARKDVDHIKGENRTRLTGALKRLLKDLES